MSKKSATKKSVSVPVEITEEGEAACGRPFVEGLERSGAFDRWLEAARARGMERGGMVWDLHVVQGRGLGEVARLLELSEAEVLRLYESWRARLAERAPKSDQDFLAAREELRERLVSILEDASRTPEDPRLLAVRQRVCDQIADLYGLNMQRRTPVEEAVPVYAQPAEISTAVEERVRDLFGRGTEILAVREVLATRNGLT